MRLCNKCEYLENPQVEVSVYYVQSHVMTPVRADRAAAVMQLTAIYLRPPMSDTAAMVPLESPCIGASMHSTYPDQMPLTLFQTKPAISPAIDVCKMVSVEPPCKGASKDTLIKAADSVQHSYSCKLLGVLTLIPPCCEYYIFHPS
jgi:hypothetical protein